MSQIRGNTQIKSGTIENDQIAAAAAIEFSKLAALTSTHILIGNNSNVATSVAMTGDIAIDSFGETSIVSGAIVNADINESAAIETSKLAEGADFLLRTGTVAMTGNLNANSNKIINLANGVNANDAVNKSQLDAAVAMATTGLNFKDPVRAATTGNITLADEQTIDGVALIAGDRVLVKNQSIASENGIYVVVSEGSWTRSADADVSEEVNAGMFCLVEEGDANADSAWVLSTENEIILGTTDLAFVKFTNLSDLIAGDGLTKANNTLNIVSGNSGIAVNPDNITLTVDTTADSLSITEPGGGGGGDLDLPEMPAAPELTVTTSITSADDLQATINAASDGDVIFLADGTYSIAANLSIAKQIALVGESQGGVLIQDTRGNSQSFVSVSVDNVTLKDLTIRHATTDSGIGHAIVASGPGWPQARLNNFRMYNVKSQYSKGGLSVRSDNFVVEGCTFEVVAGSSTRRGILHYGNGGDSFIKNCHFINSTTGALRAITPTATSGSNPNDDQAGSLTIEGSTFTGNLSQFVNMDNHQGAAGAFELIIKDNVTPETNAFVVSFGAVQNFGDLFSRIVLIGNNLTNNHAAGLGKGALALDGFNGPLSYSTLPLKVVAQDNTLGQLEFRSGYAEAIGSTDSLVGYSTAIAEPTIELVGGATGIGIKLKDGIAGQIYVADAATGAFKRVTVSGDATLSASGVLTVGSRLLDASNFIFNEIPSGDIDGSNAVFALADTPVAGKVSLFLNGILLAPTTDYTVDENAVTLQSAPVAGDNILVNYIK